MHHDVVSALFSIMISLLMLLILILHSPHHPAHSQLVNVAIPMLYSIQHNIIIEYIGMGMDLGARLL